MTTIFRDGSGGPVATAASRDDFCVMLTLRSRETKLSDTVCVYSTTRPAAAELKEMLCADEVGLTPSSPFPRTYIFEEDCMREHAPTENMQLWWHILACAYHGRCPDEDVEKALLEYNISIVTPYGFLPGCGPKINANMAWVNVDIIDAYD